MGSTYLVAKYIPDLVRQEPRNVGILLYDQGQWLLRFVGQCGDLDDLDGRSIRHLASPETYREWYHFCARAVSDGVHDPETGSLVSPHDGRFVQVPRAASRGNFILEIGPPLGVPPVLATPEELADYLHRRLVQEQAHEPEAPSVIFAQKMQRLISRYRLDTNPRWRTDYSLSAPVEGAQETLVFPYAYVNGTVRLYRRMPVHARSWEAEELQRVLHDVLWSFTRPECQRNGWVRVALMCAGSAERRDPFLADVRAVVAKVADSVIDRDSPDKTDGEFGALV